MIFKEINIQKWVDIVFFIDGRYAGQEETEQIAQALNTSLHASLELQDLTVHTEDEGLLPPGKITFRLEGTLDYQDHDIENAN